MDDRNDATGQPPLYRVPDEVPPNLTPLDRARIAAANIRIWADWLLQTGPAPAKSESLTDASKEGES